MLSCRNESSRGDADQRATRDIAFVAEGRQDRAAAGIPGADYSGSGRGAEQPGGGRAAGDAAGGGQQVAWPVCGARLGRGGDRPRSGKPRHYDADHERRIIAALTAPPPKGYARWDGSLLAKHLGDISKHQIWRVLRAQEISLARRRRWCISTDAAFAQKAADLVGLYLQPPENAGVLSVDEK